MRLSASDFTPVRPPSANFGAVFTRRWVVELILDLCGYEVENDLTRLCAVEPAVGSGAFFGVMVERLTESRQKHAPDLDWQDLAGCLQGWDLQIDQVHNCREAAVEALVKAGCPAASAWELASGWVRSGDFLLAEHNAQTADLVVGNPPYIRIEDLDARLLAAYRSACPTMGGRADVYIGFFERGLDLLKPGGKLGFICADRWMRNQYGRRLREKIVSGPFAMDASLVMHDTQVFLDEVSAYPAIAVLRRGAQGPAVLGDAVQSFGADGAAEFADWAHGTGESLRGVGVTASRIPAWHSTSESWPEGSPAVLAWLEYLAEHCAPLQDERTGTRISIGVATGADAVFVTKDPDVAEKERMLPLSMVTDTKSGSFAWSGHYLVNPWDEEGLVDIAHWPRMSRYLTNHAATLLGRSIARRSGPNWYRTIDRVSMGLTEQPMLLLQDMKAYIHPVLAPAGFYPHHNLYYLVSEEWDLEALGGLLLSEAVERQVSAYCVKMRGKTMRFQAQYLRRVRVPELASIPEDVLTELKAAFRERDRVRASTAALKAYGMRALPE
ncbi:Eco57I restriction-modification methylase domain-containing protein [Streptomyces sp. NPDC088197]|uniref:Eco57I restriction-modification methylase domain-containing protein n=1 Tax=Streptomyces sp. NPDC088197 TaxID=3365840 RepID=UPI00381EBA76